jgi:hypothetical protein
VQVGDLVRCKVTKADNTIGLVVKVRTPATALNPAVIVLTRGEKHMWSMMRLEVINGSR